jgi:hypothetical protein
MPLVLRSSGLQSPAYKDRRDFTVYEAGEPVGRIYEDRGIGTPEDQRWFWSIIAYVDPRLDIVTSGKAPTLEEAKARFKVSWESLICVLNDGAYGAEIHKLRADGVDDSGSIFGRTDLAAIAKGFGLRGANVSDVAQFKPLFDAYQGQETAELWNIHVSDRVVSPHTRRGVGRGHGKM